MGNEYNYNNYQPGYYESQYCNSSYYNKDFSILGDSVSTLEGWNPIGHNVFFNKLKCQQANIVQWTDTWWGEVISTCKGTLLVNNSWSGSRVTKIPGSSGLFPSGCSEERTSGLHIVNQDGDIITPDVILIYLGTNDWGYGIPLKRELFHKKNNKNSYYGKASPDRDKNCSFEYAYRTMLSKIHMNYPSAELLCFSLLPTFMSANASFRFPYEFSGTHIQQFNDIISKTVKHFHRQRDFRIRFLDLYKYNIPYDSIDGSHPNRNGMHTIASLVLKEIESASL